MIDRADHHLRSLLTGWAQRMKQNPDMPVQAMREMREAWHTVTTEPTNVCYEDVVAGGRKALWCLPKDSPTDRVLLYFHAGGFVVGSTATHRKFGGHLAKAVGAKTLLLDYRLAPEHVYPAPLEDALEAYRWLLREGYKPENIASCGDSSGGTLALALPLKLREEGERLPAVVFAVSPGLDWDVQMMDMNRDNDISVTKPGVQALVNMFIGDMSKDDPLVNPLHADLTGMPPTYLAVGGHENLLGSALRFADVAEDAGIDFTLDISPERQHMYTIAAGNDPAADSTIASFADWANSRFGVTNGQG
jgi:monoterpene epsilon-lactone hydrolase